MQKRWLVIAAAGVTLGCSSSAATSTGGPGPTRIATDKGEVQGAALSNARQFLNVPYAAPPTGPLRWMPPTDPAPWSGVRDATSYGVRCPQYDLLNGEPSDTETEDCLQLNVWTPLQATAKAPVMVFLHGGAFVSGSGTEPTYNGVNLAAGANVIVVTVNYRLGPFGFLAHPALAAAAGTANLGLLDQRAALAWVARNVAAFGGDPTNVTLFGELAGAISVCAHLAMPKSAGLFQRALMESGACSGAVDFASADATAQGNALANALGCTDVSTAADCLRGKTTTEILAALPIRHETIGPDGVLWGPVYGDAELPERPLDAMTAGRGAKVPLLLGTNRNEGSLFAALYDGPLGAPDVAAIASWMFGAANVDAIVARYPASAFASTKEQVAAIVTDGFFACPTRRAARAHAASGSPVYLYQFTYPFRVTLAPGAESAHGFELPFVFGNSLYGQSLADADMPLSQAMMGYWTRYAASGDPNGSGAPKWLTYDAANDANVAFDSTVTTAAGTKKSECDFWDAL